MEPLAHSARYCGQAQTYRDHVQGTLKLVDIFLSEIECFISSKMFQRMKARLSAVASLHDLGKLDEQNQKALNNEHWQGSLPILHQYAGARYFYQQGDIFSAALIYGHHLPGLPNFIEEIDNRTPFCPLLPQKIEMDARAKERFQDYTDKHLQQYLDRHEKIVGNISQLSNIRNINAIEERMMLSCLVDADWSDTGQKSPPNVATHWSEWRDKLNQYIHKVEGKAKADPSQDKERNRLRHAFYEQCTNNTDIDQPLQICEAPVGTGKTTAIFAYLLRCAEKKKLRHIFVVLPLTSILTQTESVLKDALGLNGKNAEQIIAVVHHKADYSSKELRELAAAWEAPIVLMTSVGLFETLSSNEPGHLRRLHQLPGSALFLDEFHTAAPTICLPLIWQWLTELTEQWGCSVVLSSGTSVHFWEQSDFKRVFQGKVPEQHPVKAPSPLLPLSLQEKMTSFEKGRVRLQLATENYRQCCFPDFSALLDFVLYQPGPRILMMDTRYAAALATRLLQQRGACVFHLSNAFAPQDSERILHRVENLLALSRTDYARRDWTLVSTTLAGTGLNLSFCTGFCAAISCSAYLQLAGRINRNGEYPKACLWPFVLHDPRITSNSKMGISREVWLEMIQNGIHGKALSVCSPAEQMTYAYQEECKRDFSTDCCQEAFLRMERNNQFAELATKFHIISERPAALAVTNPNLMEQLKNGHICSRSQLQRGSVSIYLNTIKKLQLREIPGFPKLYVLPATQYDPSLFGYYKTLLP